MMTAKNHGFAARSQCGVRTTPVGGFYIDAPDGRRSDAAGIGIYPYTCWAQPAPVKNRGGEFSSFVKGDLNVFRVALSPDDYINVLLLLLFPTTSHQPYLTNLHLCVSALR